MTQAPDEREAAEFYGLAIACGAMTLAQAFASYGARTMEAEREAIVHWLRSEQEMRFRLSDDSQDAGAKRYNYTRGTAIEIAADAIERGDHLPSEQGEG